MMGTHSRHKRNPTKSGHKRRNAILFGLFFVAVGVVCVAIDVIKFCSATSPGTNYLGQPKPLGALIVLGSIMVCVGCGYALTGGKEKTPRARRRRDCRPARDKFPWE
jgi:hypothetical protein